MLNLVLFGPPGSGKGTQSKKLIEKYGLIHLSTGDLLRSEIAQGTELGLEAKKLTDHGILVPDEIVNGMIDHKLEANKDAKGFIFDGFPRTVAQAEALDKMLGVRNSPISVMIALEVDDDELERRLLERGKDSGRPDDANAEVIRKRIKEYNDKTAPVAAFYKNQHKFHSLNGVGEVGEIFEAIKSVISRYHTCDEAMPVAGSDK
jgi:adenylate kinase